MIYVYKVKLFYLYSEDIGLFKEFPDIVMDDVIYDEESGLYLYLYAFTEWRKLYKRFKKERNMNIFKVKTVNEKEKDEKLNKIVRGKIISVEEKIEYIENILNSKLVYNNNKFVNEY